MAFKRRGFLRLIGAAVSAPMMPAVSVAQASTAAYPAAALKAALGHAKTRVNFSAFSLSRTLDVSVGQAEQIMTDLSARGVLGPLQGSTQSGRWALSRVWERPVVDAAIVQKASRGKARKANRRQTTPQRDASTPTDSATPDDMQHPWADMRPLMIHLQDLCKAKGLTLHPRCSALVQ